MTPEGQAASYSTGGGGTVLEHRYGAFVLAHVLSGAPLHELDGFVAPVRVRFQAGAISVVDDLVISGIRPDGTEKAVAVAARRDPRIVRSSTNTRDLVRRCLQLLHQHAEDVQAGSMRLGLASAVTSPHATDLVQLSEIARQHGDPGAFRSAISSQLLRNRLDQLQALIDDAHSDETTFEGQDRSDLAWRVLRALHVRLLRLEGGEQSDWTSAATSLVPLTNDGTIEQAFAVMNRLAVLVGGYAPWGATVTAERLRIDLGELLSADTWVDGHSRRVTREPATLRYLRSLGSKLTAIRRVGRESLGLSDRQVDLSFSQEPPIPTALSKLQPGTVGVLMGPIGSGKTDVALRWLLDGRPSGEDAWGRPVPVFIRADHLRSTIQQAIEAEVGFEDAPDRFGVDLVIDGLDERPGASPVTLAQEFVKTHPKCRVVITAREGEYLPESVATIPVAPWSHEDVRALVGAVLEKEPWQVGHKWSPEFLEAARRPLFALLAAVHGPESGAGASLVDRAVRVALERVSNRAGLEELALATVGAGRAVDPRAIEGVDSEQLRISRLVEFEGQRLRFVLPIFEQWFAAQALLRGTVPHTEFLDEHGFARWRYVLAIALSSGTWETTFPWMNQIARWNPAAGAWVVNEAVSADLRATSIEFAPIDTADLPEKIWAAMSAWVDGLGPVSPYLGPGLTLGIVAPGTLDGVRLVVNTTRPGRVSVSWVQRPNVTVPAASRGIAPGDVPQRTSWELAPDSELWPWRHTLARMDRRALESLLTDGRFLAASCRTSGIVQREYEAWLTLRALGFGERWPVRVTTEMALASVATLLASVGEPDGETVNTNGVQVSIGWLRGLRHRLEVDGDAAVRDLWPNPDRESATIRGPAAYSDERALDRANAIYEGAALAYEEIRAAILPAFGRLLPHGATFPAVLEGHFESGIDKRLNGGFGDAYVDHWMRPIRDGSQNVALVAKLEWGKSDFAITGNADAFEVFLERQRVDPLGSAYELTTIQNAVVPNEFWGRRPATHIAVEWLLRDLAHYGWVENPSFWVRLA